MIAVHDHAALQHLGRQLKVPAVALRRGLKRLYKNHAPIEAVLAELPAPAQAVMRAAVDWQPLALALRRESPDDGASKLAFRTRDGRWLETVVLRIASGRSTVCLSTQIGCAAACAFCATGRMGLARNLQAAEIVDQVVQVARLLGAEGRRLRNLVFMGMGEPLHNEAALYEALNALHDPARFNFADRHIVVSTVGVPDAMVRCAQRFPRINLALSLHSVRAAVRRQLLPMARWHSLADLRTALDRVVEIQGRRIMIEYLLLAGVTDTDEDLAALEAYLAGLPVHVNLMPFNPIADAGSLRSSPEARCRAFANALKQRGFPTTVRHSLGRSIEGACGQLIQSADAAPDPTPNP